MPSEIRVDKVSSTTSPYTPVFSTTGEALSHRNMIINGAMQVYQRGSLSITQSNNGGFALDRFKYSQGAAVGQWVGTMTQDALSDADIATTGQRNALKVLTTTVENAVGADEDSRIVYVVEAQDCQRLLHGTSAARSSTLSFWAKSTVAANYAVNIWQEDGNDTITKTYTLAANTWTKVSITIPGNTLSGGVIANDNTGGLWIQWMLIAGSDFTSSDSTSWGTYAANKLAYGHTASSVSSPWGTNASDAWYITGVQLELGTVATPFEHRSYGDELLRCQRYLYVIAHSVTNDRYIGQGGLWSSGQVHMGVRHPVTMRAEPTLYSTDISASFRVYANAGQDDFDNFITNGHTTGWSTIRNTDDIGGNAPAAGHYGGLYQLSSNARVYLIAEL